MQERSTDVEKSDTVFTSQHDLSGFLNYLAKGKHRLNCLVKIKDSFLHFEDWGFYTWFQSGLST